jgi:AcrR family transcriptional regulator
MAKQAQRIPLSKDRVLSAAMKLADEGGIKAVSMRKIAQELGVEAMSLYNHVASKDEIIDGRSTSLPPAATGRRPCAGA